MKIRLRASRCGMLLLLAGLAPAFAQPTYTLQKLSPDGCYFSEAYAINQQGQVTLRATATADSPQVASIYDAGQLTAVPEFSPAAGVYDAPISVTITSATSGATIRYTTDGSMPGAANGLVYAGAPIAIGASTRLKAIASAPGLGDSPAASGLYSINSAPAATLDVIYDFAASTGGQQVPLGALVQGGDGSLYGATAHGGSGDVGTLFKVTPGGVLTTLVEFNRDNGAYPGGNLIPGPDGNFFGTTSLGGSGGAGTVFALTPAGALTTLASFDGTNGTTANAGLTPGSDGNFYGTTEFGGASSQGTVFMMTPAGFLTTLVEFNGANGDEPAGALVQGSDGSLYGTTYFGGSNDSGTVFKVTPAGVLTTLVTFDIDNNGANPMAGLTLGRDGNFYGTTSRGGSGGQGTVFKMTPAGELTTLVSFIGSNGASPYAGLVEGRDGNFYGTTVGSSDPTVSTIFRITPAGVVTTLITFDGANGASPEGNLVQGSDGSFYGTAAVGGVADKGVVFQLTVPPQAAAPVFSPPPGAYEGVQMVEITSTTPGATIRYTTDGSTPDTTNGSVYSGPLTIGGTAHLQAVASAPGFTTSPVVAADYYVTIPLAAPVIAPEGGTYHGTQIVTITAADRAATIRYTLDGSDPTSTHGAIYCEPLRVRVSTTLKAIACRPGYHDSAVAVAKYVILPPQTLALEAESLPYAARGATAQVIADRKASGGAWVKLAANGMGDSIAFTLRGIPAELYQIKLTWKADDDRSVVCLKVDGVTVGSPLDQYSDGPNWRSAALGQVYLSPGDHVIELVVTGRRRGSHGFTVSADKFTLAGL